jgi:thioredoxin reductase (NADPH)
VTETYDVVIVGSGPAGVSAAITVANRNRSLVVLGSQEPFAHIARAHGIPNYPGLGPTTGQELRDAFLRHAATFEVSIVREKVAKVSPDGDDFLLFGDHELYRARTVVLATGVYRDGELEGEEELLGQGVSYCANCDGRLFAGRDVALVSYAAGGEEEAAVLAGDFGVRITYVPLYEGEYRLPRGVPVTAAGRPERLERAEGGGVRVVLPGQELAVDGVFIYKEAVSPHALLDGVESDGRHLIVDRHLQTSVPGVFAAGDCSGEPYQVAKAAGEGQVAALSAIRYLRRRAKEASGGRA